jgi:hypothetical protein
VRTPLTLSFAGLAVFSLGMAATPAEAQATPAPGPTQGVQTPTGQTVPGQTIPGQTVPGQTVSGAVTTPAGSPAGQVQTGAQTTTDGNTTGLGSASPSQQPATTHLPGSPVRSVPPPQPASSFPSLPGYGQPSGTVPSIPPATPGAKPIVVQPASQQLQSPSSVAVPSPPPAPQQTSPAPPATTASAPVQAMPPYIPYGVPDEEIHHRAEGSTYISVDSFIYPEMTRLYSLGYVSTMFLSMRPWTRQSVLHMLDESEDEIRNSDSEEAQQILLAIQHQLRAENPRDDGQDRGRVYGVESVYARAMGIGGTTLRDSFHLGQTINNDYGRPYEAGFNSLLGFSTIGEWGRFSYNFRGEYQHAPSAPGYSQTLSSELSFIDSIPYSGYNLHQATIPTGPIPAANPFHMQEIDVSAILANHEFSFGKSDAWLGPGQGGAMAWSNNAQDIYSFRINRVEPLHIPFVSALLGPVRYDFFYGDLKGHTDLNHSYVHSEMFSFRPTKNFEFAFQRTVVFGGEGHQPVTIHTFLKSFFDISDTTAAEKVSVDDPGARFSDFSFSYRLPFLRKYATLYADSIAHDDVTPPSAPRRAAYRPGIYLSQIPGMRRLDFRVEGVSTDTSTLRSLGGQFNYVEAEHTQAYTNEGFIMGDWIGREAKGGQAWLTYNLSGNEWIQFEYLNKKTPKDFIGIQLPNAQGIFDTFHSDYALGGTTQNEYKASVVKRFDHDNIELNAWFQYEGWKAPIYKTGIQRDVVTTFQVTFFPQLKSRNTGY